MSSPLPARRLLLVHAHPDDETLSTGATMAKYAAMGAHVTLITCTSGEEGEVVVPELAHLAADRDDALGQHRRVELMAATALLGVSDVRHLGGPGHYRDSGMMDLPSNQRPDCFWQADLLEAATRVAAVIREVRPQVLVTYDDFGGYGHPDHIQAHRVAMYAVALAAVPSFAPELGPPWQIAKVYWLALPRSVAAEALAATPPEQRGEIFGGVDPQSAPFLIDDEWVTTAIDAREALPAKVAAMSAHASQIDMTNSFFAHVAVGGPDALGIEYYRLALGELGQVYDGREVDLFAGIG